MCGRFAFTKIDKKELKDRFQLTKIPKDLKPRYNVTPTQIVPAILNETPQELSLVRWGLVPSWAKELNTKYSMINARSETITEKPAYRGIIKHKRCLIIADSFYEWKKAEDGKHPYRIMLKDEGLFAFAGVWDHWERDRNEITSCSIITTAANKLMRDIHDRMPVLLPKSNEEEWLSNAPLEKVLKLLKPLNANLMEAYEISTLVNSPSNNIPEILKPVSS